ncbi:RNA polymerase sigma factor [Paenibacillus sp. NFR01]|uniref:RNA polymerase sigma factor n=1 Tax=Paenibacillus sp. NFR01 TaxID=1566279 RepID=UPI0008B3BCD3|nr:RNA polymerase sigma factor [Paenibacillus sp. NFR01]SET90444.1 RNA polymerase sigma-70 factor, ECF subfamily [Paenibacillus sp. NFR01]
MDPSNEAMAGLLAQMCEGSAAAFDEFYACYAPFVMQIACRQTGDRMEAEDICHDIFLEVLRKGGAYDSGRGSIKAWLAVMTRSRCIDRQRRKARSRPVADPEELIREDAGPGQDELAVRKLQCEALGEALRQLPDNQKKAIVASYFGAQTHQELAASWSVPLGTVKSWIKYGVGNMRKQFMKQGWIDQPEGGMQHEPERKPKR